MAACLLYSITRWLHGRCTWLLIIRFTEHKAALIGFKFLLIGIYGELLSRNEGWEAEKGVVNKRAAVSSHCAYRRCLQGSAPWLSPVLLLNGKISKNSLTYRRKDSMVVSKGPPLSIQREKCPLRLIFAFLISWLNGQELRPPVAQRPILHRQAHTEPQET